MVDRKGNMIKRKREEERERESKRGEKEGG